MPASIQQQFDLALRHYRAGRLSQAQELCTQVLAQQPEHAEACRLLGLIARQAGKNEAAIDLLRRAIRLNPDFSDACLDLGNVLRSCGQIDAAVAAYRQAIFLRPDLPGGYINLGAAFIDKGRNDEAIAAFRQAISLSPAASKAHSNLAVALVNSGRFDEAILACRQALAIDSNLAEAHCNLGDALKGKGQLDEAIAAFACAVKLRPDYAQAYNCLGVALQEGRRASDAVAALRQAIALRPNDADAHNNLGVALIDLGQFEEAIAAFREAFRCNPRLPEAYSNLGDALRETERLDEAILVCRQAIALRPDLGGAYNNLANALKDSGLLDESIIASRQAIALMPNSPKAYSNLIFAMHLHPDCSPEQIAGELRCWNRQHAKPLGHPLHHLHDRSPERRLRVGYVSADFRDHVIGRNLLPLFRRHDHRQLEVFGYANLRGGDAMTREFQTCADAWCNIANLSDEQTAAQIREDRIDLLVDLSLHTRHNRLLVFARKPAPVQVTFAGYPSSTGLTAIDYRLSDPYLDPFDSAHDRPFDAAHGDAPEKNVSIYSEKTVRLASSFWCYDPLDVVDVQVNPLPAIKAGFITFGCLSSFWKINPRVLSLWAQVLVKVKDAHLLLLAPAGSHRQRVVDYLRSRGVNVDQIDFAAPQPRRQYLELYHRIDIGLDCFPYNGHTTSLDSLWMGVPIVTLVGQTPVSRAGWCHAANLGLQELAAHNEEQFVEIAANLAGEQPRLQELRAQLRVRMEQSPLMDAQAFAQSVESSYRQMWRKYCQAASAGV